MSPCKKTTYPICLCKFKEMEHSDIVLYSGEAVALVGVLHLLVVFGVKFLFFS